MESRRSAQSQRVSGGVHLTGDPDYQEELSGYNPGGRKCYPFMINRLPWPQRLDRTEECDEIREESRLNTNDLIQQRRSADAADAMAVLSYNQAWVGLTNLLVGLGTLFAAIVAAYFAGSAAFSARSAADAAWLAVEITRDHGEAELCAYCIVERAEIKTYSHDVVIEIAIRNIGGTVATDVHLRGDFMSEKIAPDPHRDVMSKPINMRFGTIYPSELTSEWDNISDFSVPPEQKQRLMAGNHEARGVTFTIEWRDIFKRTHTAQHRLSTRDATRESFIQTHTLKDSETMLPIWRGAYSVTPKEKGKGGA
jgi:hypothetical protein